MASRLSAVERRRRMKIASRKQRFILPDDADPAGRYTHGEMMESAFGYEEGARILIRTDAEIEEGAIGIIKDEQGRWCIGHLHDCGELGLCVRLPAGATARGGRESFVGVVLGRAVYAAEVQEFCGVEM